MGARLTLSAIVTLLAAMGTPALAVSPLESSSPGAFAQPASLTEPAAPEAPLRVVPESRPAMQFSFAPVVDRATPGVVTIWGAAASTKVNSAYLEQYARRYFGDAPPEAQRVSRSLASGVVVDAGGLVVTNDHVVDGQTALKAVLADGREFEADVALREPRMDMAVLRLKGAEALPALPLADSEALRVGDLVLAIGNPFGVGQTVTEGIVSALARTEVEVTDYQFFIQTDAAINPGNSGGALVDMRGHLVGINTVILSPTGGSHGVGFAVPSNMVRLVVEAARAGHRNLQRPWIGARLQAARPENTVQAGLPRLTGTVVAALFAGGPADRAGLRAGDVVVAVAGVPVSGPEALTYRLSQKGVSGVVPVEFVREGQRHVADLTLEAPPETRPREPIRLAGRSPLAGATAVNLSPAVADELALSIGAQGVVITAVEPKSIASENRFKTGDVIVAVAGKRVETSRDLETLLSEGGSAQLMTLYRKGRLSTRMIGTPAGQDRRDLVASGKPR
jgi:Do/DeqQ family serine protease